MTDFDARWTWTGSVRAERSSTLVTLTSAIDLVVQKLSSLNTRPGKLGLLLSGAAVACVLFWGRYLPTDRVLTSETDSWPTASVAPLVFGHEPPVAPDNSAATYKPLKSPRNTQSVACAYRNICLSDWRHRTPPGPIEVWLLDDRGGPLDATALEALQACLHTSITGRQTQFVSKALPAHPQWVNGTTAMMLKFEPLHHPAAWAKAWAALVSTVAWQRDVLGIRTVEHVQLLDQDYPLNGWEEFFMHSALEAIETLLSNDTTRPEKTEHTYGMLRAPSFASGKALADVQPDSPICYRAAFAARPLSTEYVIPRPPPTAAYFVDAFEADLFRRSAYRALGFKDKRPVRRRPADLKAVVLFRDRIIWNQDDVVRLLHEQGLTDVVVTTVSDRTPYYRQAAVFYGADILVSIHGSQLANQVFMRRGSGVIELFPALFFHNEPGLLGRVLGLDAISLIGTSLPPRSVVATVKPDMLEHLEHCQQLSREFSTIEMCSAVFHCRDSMRRLGAWVNLDAFAAQLHAMVQRLLRDGDE